MSGYHGRRAPNVSQYLANLNTIPSAHDLAAQQAADLSHPDHNLESLTNAEFFDFDALNVDFDPPPTSAGEGLQDGCGNVADPQYQFMSYPSSSPLNGSSIVSQQLNAPVPANFKNTIAAQRSPQTAEQGLAGGSGARNSLDSPVDLEEQSRLAAEEDKRRRNTAASARFRVKKKQREQALEKQSKEMGDKIATLENKVHQLEMENRWLKDLVTDKHGVKTLEELKGERKQQKEEEERSTSRRRDGVGTSEGKVAQDKM